MNKEVFVKREPIVRRLALLLLQSRGLYGVWASSLLYRTAFTRPTQERKRERERETLRTDSVLENMLPNIIMY